jgi:glycosyltransferase involved in cell wall biosynthesis
MHKTYFILNSIYSGGTGRVALRLASSIPKSECNISVVTLKNIQPKIYEKYCKKVDVIQLNANNKITAIIKLSIFLIKHKPQCCLAFNYTIPILLVLLRKLRLLDASIIMRSMNMMTYKLENTNINFIKKYKTRLIKLGMLNCDHIITQSKEMKSDALAYLGKKSPPITYIYNPIEPKSVLNNEHRKYYNVLCVARHEMQKDLRSAIKLINILSKKNPLYHLFFAGSGSQTQELRNYARELNLQDHVSFLGQVDDMDEVYSYCGVCILTSLYEGFPNALLESISVGIPVVAFDCPSGPKEIIKDGINGYLVTNRDVKVMAQKVQASRDLKIGQVKNTADCFHASNISRQYVDVIKKSILFHAI